MWQRDATHRQKRYVLDLIDMGLGVTSASMHLMLTIRLVKANLLLSAG